MSNMIPPLVCNTPPPIDDFDDQMDDVVSGLDSSDEDPSLPGTPYKRNKSATKDIDLPMPESPLDLPTIPSATVYINFIENEVKCDNLNTNPKDGDCQQFKPIAVEPNVIEKLAKMDKQVKGDFWNEAQCSPGMDSGKPLFMESLEEPFKEPLKEYLEEPLEESLREHNEDPLKETLEDPLKESLESPLKNSLVDSVTFTLEDPAEDDLKEPMSISFPAPTAILKSQNNQNESCIEPSDQYIDDHVENIQFSPPDPMPDENLYRSDSPPSLILSNDSSAADFIDDFHTSNAESSPSLHINSNDNSRLPTPLTDISNNGDRQMAQSVDITTLDDNFMDNNAMEANYDSAAMKHTESNQIEEKTIEHTNASYPQLNLDDSFEEFVEYSDQNVAKPIEIEIETMEVNPSDENEFAADFSNFEAFAINEIPVPASVPLSTSGIRGISSHIDDDFGDFEDFDDVAVPVAASHAIATESDDDFGDFSDFSQSQPQIPILRPNVENIESKVSVLLDMMFPCLDTDHNDESTNNDERSQIVDETMLNKTIKVLKNFDNSKALDYQWLTSVGKNSLVTALGIDSRNILYGGKWNSSMPRYAANLGFSPLEPMKSDAVQPSSTGAKCTTDVPAAQFDWNSSGLVNPLDGVQEIIHEANAAQTQSARIESYWPSATVKSTIGAATITNAITTAATTTTEISAEPSTVPASPHQFQLDKSATNETRYTQQHIGDDDDDDDEPPAPTSSSYVIPGSGSLKETHIYTPSKVQSQFRGEMATSVQPPTESVFEAVECPDFDYKQAAAGIIIDENVVKKEYRDVEYNLEKLTVSTSIPAASIDEFSDFQSVPITSLPSPPLNILQPTKADQGITIDWPDPGIVVDERMKIDDFDQFVSKPNRTETSAITKSSMPSFSKPVFGISPTEHMFASVVSDSSIKTNDDEFTDFQSVAAPIRPLPIQHSIQNDATMWPMQLRTSQLTPRPISSSTSMEPTSVPLQPSSTILLPQSITSEVEPIKQNISWPDPGIDPDEMARLEAIFPTPKVANVTPKHQPATAALPKRQTSEDVEWTDFVSGTQSGPSSLSHQPITNIINQNIVRHQQQQQQQSQHNDDDDWSDFVSSAPYTSSSQSFHQKLPGPNFPSWNAPPQFSPWHQPSARPASASLFQPPPPPFVPIILPTAPTNNNKNGFQQPNFNLKMDNGGSMFYKNQKAPSISLIPDLGFAAPKPTMHHVINNRPVSRSNSNYTKK